MPRYPKDYRPGLLAQDTLSNRRPPRSCSERIARLRERVKQAAAANPDDPMPGIVAGMLDLLEDEL